MFMIVSHLKFYGENISDNDMLEKMYSTFHPSDMTLSQQNWMYNFKKYSELTCLIVADQQNKLSIKIINLFWCKNIP